MKDTVPENVQNAFLAIALNERRGSFKPMVYTKARRGTNVTQCVFCGCHSDIGGGNLDAGLSTVSLLWMAAKIQRLVRISELISSSFLFFSFPFFSFPWQSSGQDWVSEILLTPYAVVPGLISFWGSSPDGATTAT